jgi:hypothetical protein
VHMLFLVHVQVDHRLDVWLDLWSVWLDLWNLRRSLNLGRHLRKWRKRRKRRRCRRRTTPSGATTFVPSVPVLASVLPPMLTPMLGPGRAEVIVHIDVVRVRRRFGGEQVGRGRCGGLACVLRI